MATSLGWPFQGMLLLIICQLASAKLGTPATDSKATTNFNRTSFPENFMFGVASSSYQVASETEPLLSSQAPLFDYNISNISSYFKPCRYNLGLHAWCQLSSHHETIKIHTVQMVIRRNQAELIAS